jgi:hypothetical protein
MGKDAVAMKSKTVTIEADGVCSIKGKMALKLQEAEGPKGKKEKGSGSGESQGAKRHSKTLQEGRERIAFKVVYADGKPVADQKFKLTTPSGTVIEDRTPVDGIVTVKGITKVKCKLEWID